MELTPIERMMVAAKQQILLNKATHKKKPICQWCFEEPAVEGKTVCQACLEEVERERIENKDFDLDKWLNDTEEETIERR